MSEEVNNIEGATEYQVLEAVISSDRSSIEIDIKALVSEFIIYEHIDKPYLTMRITFKEEENVLQDMDFQGGEKLEFSFVQSEEIETSNRIEKTFLIDEVVRVVKIDERTDFVELHCVEYHMFESSAQNISKCYSGAPSKIIQQVIENYVDKKVLIDGEDSVGDMKVIVPNLNPIEAAMWLLNRTTTNQGMPFFLFSAVGVENLVLRDLSKILEQVPINSMHPYTYAPSANDGNHQHKFYLIQSFRYEGSENLLSIMRKGLVGADYMFYDTYSGIPDNIHHDVDDVFKSLARQNLLGGENSRYSHSSEYKVKDTKIGELSSKLVSQVTSSGAYKNLGTSYRSYNDETNSGNQTKKINKAALREFLVKTPLTITVKGREFITGDANYTIGKIIRVKFLDNNPLLDDGKAAIDQKKSGDYIIMGAKHVFNGTTVNSELVCGRVASLGTEAEL